MFIPKGFKFCGINSGIRVKGKDLGIIFSETPSYAWGTFTRNRAKAAPVIYDEKIIKNGKLQAIIVNSGIANAGTGDRGLKDVYREVECAEEVFGISSDLIAVSSTGKIGPYLPIGKIENGIKQCRGILSKDGYKEFAHAIMTTDTIEKIVSKKITIEGEDVHLLGIAKGSGMINPDMATMLSFVVTDVNISLPMLKLALVSSVEKSFNLITVDGDTSTNDTVLIMANGFSKNEKINREDVKFEIFSNALLDVLKELSYMIAKDGEGATKLIKIRVKGTKSFYDAKVIGKTIANSLLVKTALYGADPNWGRVLAAVGYSGIDFDPNKIDIFMGKKMLENGVPISFSRSEIREYLGKKEIEIIVDLKLGQGEAVVLTTDLTHEYININTQYS